MHVALGSAQQAPALSLRCLQVEKGTNSPGAWGRALPWVLDDQGRKEGS